MNQPIIAVDVDEVCADLLTEWIARYNILWNDTLKVEDIDCWEVTKFVKPECGNKIFDILHNGNLYDCVKPIPGALGAVQELRQLGRVIFVSSGNGTAKLEWLKRHGFLENHRGSDRDFFMAKDKSLVRADFLFDDYNVNVETFPGVGVLVDHSHNRSVVTLASRISSLASAPAVVRRFVESYPWACGIRGWE